METIWSMLTSCDARPSTILRGASGANDPRVPVGTSSAKILRS